MLLAKYDIWRKIYVSCIQRSMPPFLSSGVSHISYLFIYLLTERANITKIPSYWRAE